MCQKSSGYVPEKFWLCARKVLAMCQKSSGYVPEKFWLCARNAQTKHKIVMLAKMLLQVYTFYLWIKIGGVMAERSSLLDSSSGVSSRMWVRIPVVTLVSLSKTLNHNCFVLRMGRKAVGPVCCVMHVKEPRTLIVKEKGLAPVFLEWQLNAPKLIDRRLWMGPQILCAL